MAAKTEMTEEQKVKRAVQLLCSEKNSHKFAQWATEVEYKITNKIPLSGGRVKYEAVGSFKLNSRKDETLYPSKQVTFQTSFQDGFDAIGIPDVVLVEGSIS